MAYIPKGGPVPVHPWLLALRFIQSLLAIVIVATTAYPLSIEGGGPLKAPLISTIIIALLTLLPILPLTTPLHISQRRLYDPRIALVLDLVAALFWLASFAALASYLDIFHGYGRELRVADLAIEACEGCRGAWRSGVAAAVFAIIEFLLFLFTTLAFVYYYHCHLAHETAYGIAEKNTGSRAHDSTYAIPYSATEPTANGVAGEHQMRSPSDLIQPQTHSGLDQHLSMAENHGTAHIPHPQMSDFGAFKTSHPPTPHPQTAGYSGAFRTSHSPTTSYGAPPAVNGGASPIREDMREGAVSPPLPPRSPSRLERTEGYGFESLGHAGAGAGADTMRP